MDQLASGGQTVLPNGPKRVKTAQKRVIEHGLGSFFGEQKTQFRPVLDPFWGHLGPLGGDCVWGRSTPFTGPKQAKHGQKGRPHVAQVDSVPRYGHQTPVVHVPGPSGPVWGRLGPFLGCLEVKLAKERTLGAENTHNEAQQDP